MKKLFFIFISIHTCVFAQTNFPSNYVAINHGLSIPLGQYATKNIKTGTYATLGQVTSIDFARYKNNWGWAGTISVAEHPIDKSSFESQLKNDGLVAHTNDSSKWLASTVMGGLAYGATKGKFTFEMNFLTGFFFAKTPSMTVENKNSIPTDYWKFYNVLWECVGGIGIQTKAQLRYQFSKHWQLKANAALYNAKIKYKTTQEAVPEFNQPQIIHEYLMPVAVLDFTLGIGYRFAK
jgi:hypothetical protein